MVDDDDADPRVQEAQRRISQLALNLQRIFSPIDSAGLLLGGACGILETALGREAAAKYLLLLAKEMRGEPPDDEPTLN
jgi:hypothetical protein